MVEGGSIRHAIMDAGRDQLVAFMEARDVPGIPKEYDAGINRGLVYPARFIILLLKQAVMARSSRSGRSSSLRVSRSLK
jgi:hypothetical protein